MRTTAELREGFLSYFESKGHKRHPSGSLVPPAWDHSTLLNSAGMQPLMPYFLGREEPPAPLLATSQKIFRTPDIDEVGLDGFHLTFFEMLGNFSFGQYFKEGAIDFAWEFVFDYMKIDPDLFWVTVFAGDPELGLGEDEEAVRLWEQIGMPPERIIRLDRSHNFWSVGGPGPCGPDTELFYDRGEALGCGRPECAPGCTCERYLEFWNLVFMEFELHPDGTVTPLPKQNVDTGMGLERAASILQGVISVYETDGYQSIMDWIATESGVAVGESEKATKAHRILADHGRGMTFLVGDGVLPSNEGRGYVLRRIIRRAVQQARTIGLDDLWPITEVVAEQMGPWYPELVENRERIQEIVRAEEERFSQTLERGLKLFEEIVAKGAISGEDAFLLHDTYGFPLELTRELSLERGMAIDEETFTRLMSEQRARSRSGGGREEARAAQFAASAGFETEFVGYEKTEVLTQIGALEELEGGDFLAKLRESPFYPEGGGQVSDAGFIEHDETGARADLEEAYRVGDDQVLLFHGEGFAEGDRVRAVVPWKVRFPTMANHTATHLLHQALRDVLGDHVQQAGSAVKPDKLRFDFTHGQALTPEERGRGGADRQREGLREPAGADVRDADRRGAQPRGDDALRREVRRRGARGRDPGLLSRAVRRHTRPLDRRDRAVRPSLRSVRRLRRAENRSRHFLGCVRLSPGQGARGRGAARRARASPQGGEERAESLSRGRHRVQRRVGRDRDRRGEGAQGPRAAGALRSDPAVEAGERLCCSAPSTTAARTSSSTSTSEWSRRAPTPSPSSRRRRRRSTAEAAAKPTLAEAGGKNPDGLAEAYEVGRSEIASALR